MFFNKYMYGVTFIHVQFLLNILFNKKKSNTKTAYFKTIFGLITWDEVTEASPIFYFTYFSMCHRIFLLAPSGAKRNLFFPSIARATLVLGCHVTRKAKP